jgi:hypothetical protein
VLRSNECILHIGAKIADGCLDPAMARQDLDGAQVTGLLVDQSRLRAPKRKRSAIVLR